MKPSSQVPVDRRRDDEAQATAPSTDLAAQRRAACPEQLDPQALADAIRDDDWITAEQTGLARCRECGQCDQIAPTAEPLLPWLRYGKGELAWREHERARAPLSRHRHNARQARLERQAQARAERLKARERAAPPATTSQPALPPAVAAALARARRRNTTG